MLKRMYVDVLPLKRLPRSLGVFTYQIDLQDPPEAIMGRWVRVPFRKQTLDAILWRTHGSKPAGKTVLPITEVLPLPALSEEQRRMASFLAEETFVSLSHALLVMLPPRPLRSSASKKSPPILGETGNLTLPRSRQALLHALAHQFASSAPTKPTFLPLGPLEERASFLLSYLSDRPRHQHLIVAPTIEEIQRLAPLLRRRFGDRCLILHGQMAKGMFWERWQSVAHHHDVILLTTKRGIFAPFTNLRSIVLDLETDPSHHQAEQNPRYHVRDMLLRLAQLHRASFFALDAIPSLALAALPHLSTPEIQLLPQRRQTVDLTTERQRRSFAPLAESVVELLRQARGTAVLFHNRRGYSRSWRCSDCGWLARCATCSLPLIFHAEGLLRCHRCGVAVEARATCPQCAGTRLNAAGTGTERLEEYAHSVLGDKTIVRIDHEQPRLTEQTTPDIIVATEQLLALPVLPRVATLVITNIDALLQVPDFAVAEHVLQLLERLAALVIPNGTVIVQTYDVDQPVVRAFVQRHPDLLYRQELALRQKLVLPPAGKVVKLILKMRSPATADREANRLVQTLKQAGIPGVTIEGPILPRPERQGPWWRRFLLLRFLPEVKGVATLKHVLSALPDSWLVDSSPESLTR